MNRRTMLKHAGTVGALAIVAPSVLLQTACGDTKQLVRWVVIVIGALKDVSPILGEMEQSVIVALISRAVPIAEKLKKAFEDNDHVSTLQFLDNLINPDNGLIVQIADAVWALPDGDPRKRLVLGLLAIGMVALRLISANIEQEVPVAAADSARRAQPSAARSIERAAKADALTRAFAAAKF